MCARLAGYGGSIQVGGTAVTGIREWTLDYTITVLDGMGFDDNGLPNPVMGPRDWGGSFRGPKDGAPQTLFTKVGVSLKESATAGQGWSGSAFISEVHPNVAVDGLAEYSYSYVGSGTLTVATA